MSEIVYAIEQPADLLAEIQPTLKRHWAALANNQDKVRLSPDYIRYAKLAERDQLLIATAREGGRLIGYWIQIILPEGSLHYLGTPYAESDIFWVDPEDRRRGIGSGLLGMIERTLKERFGRVIVRGRTKVDHPAAANILSDAGYVPVEFVFEKVLG